MTHETRSKKKGFSRREFMKTAGAAGMAAFLAANGAAGRAAEAAAGGKRRFAHVGVGGRSSMYRNAIQKTYADHCEMVGFCDTNQGRLLLAQAQAKKDTGKDVPIYDAKDFDKMVAETKPETVIVTTVDGFHHQYIVRAMELGCDAITEKPLTTEPEKCQAIVDAQKKTGRKCTVTFNYRYSPPRSQVKELLMSGVIGEVRSVDFHWMLNTLHGADYFRRWHSQKKFSGGLMIHKASHHFDLVNWWLSAVPVSVYATGKREFYMPEMAKRFGLQSHHERCHTCPEKEKCAFELSLAKSPSLKALYLDCEKYDGYFRDRCVFRPDIDIEDTMNVLVRYDDNVTLCYSLNAFNAWEGYVVVFNGTKGRLEHKIEEKVYVFGDAAVPGAVKPEGTHIRVYPLRDPAYEVEVRTGEGGHGGGDAVLLDDLFAPEKKKDPLQRAADQRAGAYAMLVGAAANRAFATGLPVQIADLVKGVGRPDYPEMPPRTGPIPMPTKGAKE